MQFKVSEWAGMNPDGQRKTLEGVVRAAKAPANGKVTELRARVAEYEARNQMSSDEMRRRFAAGTLQETADVSRWLMLLSLLSTLDRVR